MKERKEKIRLYCADPTVPLHSTHQLSITDFDFREFLSTGFKWVNLYIQMNPNGFRDHVGIFNYSSGSSNKRNIKPTFL